MIIGSTTLFFDNSNCFITTTVLESHSGLHARSLLYELDNCCRKRVRDGFDSLCGDESCEGRRDTTYIASITSRASRRKVSCTTTARHWIGTDWDGKCHGQHAEQRRSEHAGGITRAYHQDPSNGSHRVMHGHTSFDVAERRSASWTSTHVITTLSVLLRHGPSNRGTSASLRCYWIEACGPRTGSHCNIGGLLGEDYLRSWLSHVMESAMLGERQLRRSARRQDDGKDPWQRTVARSRIHCEERFSSTEGAFQCIALSST